MAGNAGSRRNSHQSFDVSSHSIPLRDLGSNQPQASPAAGASHDTDPSQHPANLPPISTYWDGPHQQHPADPADLSPSSPIDPAAFSYALPPDINSQLVHDGPSVPFPYITENPYYDETSNPDYFESDSAPLTASAEPISGTLDPRDQNSQPRDSFQTISDGNSPGRSRGRSANMLGFDLESGSAPGKHSSYGQSLSPTGGRSRANSTTDALLRASSMVRAMSQRVVNISGEGDAIEQQQRRDRSRSPSIQERHGSSSNRSSVHAGLDTSYPSQLYPESPLEKAETHWTSAPVPHQPAGPRLPMVNPLKGRSLGIFPPESPIRKRLCDLLVHPIMEPLLLVLIVFQTILLAVQSAHNVFDDGYGRPQYWDARDWTNWAQLILFIIFTMETAARIVVSGFILNAAEYSSVDRKKGTYAIIADWYNKYFKDQQQGSGEDSREGMGNQNYGPATFARSFTMMHGQRLPETVEEQQRMQLARRAFLRHGFNRLDFVAVVSYWITFVLSITGIEAEYHVYIFRMMSCLRIVRLLALTNGTSIILRSLKKAAPMLLRVSFLLGFFWLVFAIIGVQSFKSSFGRQCVWLDPMQPEDFSAAYTNDESFCGGYLDNQTGDPRPWVKFTTEEDLTTLQDGTGEGKGFLCPRGSICLEQESPSNGTVKFDDIVHSLELVFVIMSANTWSDLMYQTTKSDFLPAALFFGFGIMIMMLWLTNLMIAVITSSFQVIREEGKTSAFTDTQEPLVPVVHERGKRLSTLQKVYNKTSIIWILLIAFDLLCQSLRSDNMADDRKNLIAASAIIVCVLLDIEIAIRFAINWRHFHRSTQNLFDLGLAVANTIILIPPIRNSGLAYDWLTIFQILRAYRVVMAIPITRELILLVLGNAAGIANLILFVFLITFIMAIFACQLFRGEIPLFDDSGELIEISFYNIFNSFIGMYQILSSENWTALLYNITAYTTYLNTSWYGAAFLIGWFTLAWFIIINMFIAVIQENFDVSEDEKRLEQVKAFLQMKELGAQATSTLALSEIFSFRKKRKQKDPLDYGPATMEMLLKDAVVREFLDESMDTLNAASDENRRHEQERSAGLGVLHSQKVLGVWNAIRKPFVSREPNPFYDKIRFDGNRDAFDPRQMARQVVTAATERRKAQREYLARHPTYNNSLYIFTPTNPIRRLCQRLVGPGRGNERFDGVEPNKIAWYSFSAFMFAAVVAMVVLACVTTPLYQKEYWAARDFELSNWFVWIDTSFAVIFTIEAAIKIIADGWFFTPNAYYRSSWGIIDGIVLISLWINVMTTLGQGGMITGAIGVVKAFRALRLLNVSNSARDTFHSLIIVAGWKIVSAALVSLSLLIPFAIYATTLFNGKMVICNDGDVTTLDQCFGEYEASPFNEDWAFIAPKVAENPYYSFDDFGSSLFILFQIVSQEGWVDVSFSAQSITDKNLQPQPMASVGNAMFFVVFNLLGTVFVLTLFISVFMRNYTEQTGVAYLTADQRSWLELRKLLRQIAPSRSSYDDTHEKPWRRWCHKRAIEKHGKWYLGNTVVLVLHLVLLMLEYYPEPDWWRDTRNGVFLFFTFIYIANIAIRVIGLGWSRFRKSSWDIYSIFAVAGAFITSIMSIASQSFEPLEQLHKYFLVAIVLLLIPRNDALDQLFKTAAASFTTILNLLITWMVFFLVFGIALNQTLGLTRFGGGEDSDINVRTVPQAMILLFRMSTGEGWNEVMEDFADITPPLCVEDHFFFESDCGSPTWARFLFIAWNIISMYIFVNLFISLIYESFSYVYQQSSGLAHVDRDDIRRFKEAWRSVDPTGTGFISPSNFPKLLAELSGIFDMRVYGPEDSIGQIIRDVRNETHRARHTSIGNPNAVVDLDINKLNERLAKIDVHKARERRRIYKIFYEEIKVSADPERGISFTTVLMIMAHYKIINDSKSLKLEEFLRRRARLQRVEEEVRRRVVIGFFDTLYWTRYFKRHMEKKKSGRMAGIPNLDVPDIFVDDEEEREQGTHHRATIATQSVSTPTTTADGHLAAGDSSRPTHKSWSPSVDISTYDSSMMHPLAVPRASPSTPGNGLGDDGLNFNLQDPGLASNDEARRGSSVSPGEVRGLLDDSVWVESIRRSATVRKSVRKSNRSFQ